MDRLTDEKRSSRDWHEMKKEQGHKIHFFPENLLRSGLIKSGKGRRSSKSKLKPSPALFFILFKYCTSSNFPCWFGCSAPALHHFRRLELVHKEVNGHWLQRQRRQRRQWRKRRRRWRPVSLIKVWNIFFDFCFRLAWNRSTRGDVDVFCSIEAKAGGCGGNGGALSSELAIRMIFCTGLSKRAQSKWSFI